MPVSAPDLHFTTERHPLVGTGAIVVWKAEDKKNLQSFLQVKFIEKSGEKIDFTTFENYVTDYVKKLCQMKPTLENAASTPDEKSLFINFLTKTLKLNNPQLIDNKALYTSSNNRPINVDFYCLETIEYKNEKGYSARFGYEMLKTNNKLETQPVYCVEVSNSENRSNTINKKIYFFPISELSFEKIKSIFTETPIINTATITSLEIPYVLYTPVRQNVNYDNDIQTRIELQILIANTLRQLKTEKKSHAAEKKKQLLELSQEISAGKSLEQIQRTLNSSKNKSIFSKHEEYSRPLPYFFKPKAKPSQPINVRQELENLIHHHYPPKVESSNASAAPRPT